MSQNPTNAPANTSREKPPHWPNDPVLGIGLASRLPAPAMRPAAGETGFHSILFEQLDSETEAAKEPEFFRDLNLDQVIEAITAGRDEYNLKPFFYVHLTKLAAIEYRHEIMRNLEREEVFETIQTFSARMRDMRSWLKAAQKSYYQYERDKWFLDAARSYCETVERLLHELLECEPESRGLLRFRSYLADYTQSSHFKSLLAEAKKIESDLAAIRYCLLIRDSRVTVRNFADEPDYTAAVEEVFMKFKQGAVKDYRCKFASSPEMNHVEAMVVEGVAQLNPEVFRALDNYYTRHQTNFLDSTIARFDREIQFYVAYLEYAQSFQRSGLKFCYPRLSDTNKTSSSRKSFDLALAGKFSRENTKVVCNDFFLDDKERIIVVTGPNQGGKTTFARAFGQLHYLASLGCPVAGAEARLFLFDKLFVHFEREENVATLRGKLEDDLLRIHRILEEATPRSVIIMNEIFSSTTLQDATYLARKVIERISELDAICVCVTFLDELATLNEKTVSMMATVVPENPTLRTYKIERKPADGLSYSLAIAEKYRVTYQQLKERIKP